MITAGSLIGEVLEGMVEGQKKRDRRRIKTIDNIEDGGNYKSMKTKMHDRLAWRRRTCSQLQNTHNDDRKTFDSWMAKTLHVLQVNLHLPHEELLPQLLLLLLAARLAAAGPSLAGASAPAVLVTDSRMTRMVALANRGASCSSSNDRTYIRRVVLEAPRHMVREMSDGGMDALMAACKQMRRGAGFIFPGTKWCGPGNVAVGYHDLGERESEDSCCREHDNCPSQLGAGECRSGLCNTSPFTASHCDCDARFRRCLQTVNSDTAHALGTLYFNVGQVKCFKEQRPCPDIPNVNFSARSQLEVFDKNNSCPVAAHSMALYREGEIPELHRTVRRLLSQVARLFN